MSKEKGMKLGRLLNKPQRYLKYRPNATWTLPDQYIGVEVEVEGAKVASLQKFDALGTPRWNRHLDNMLRDNGQEFTTSDGLFGEDLFEAINELYEFIPGSGWKISERTGIHIHLDVSDMELLAAFRTLVAVYLIFETPLFNFIGEDRRNNIHCLPWQKAQGNLDKLGDLFNPDLEPDMFQMKVGSLDRYSALNFASLQKYGTIEFRHMKTTFDKDKLINWINLIMSMKRFAREYGGTVDELLLWARKDVRELAVAIFGENRLRESGMWYGLTPDCVAGTNVAIDVFVLYKPNIDNGAGGWRADTTSIKDGLAQLFFQNKTEEPKTRKVKKVPAPMFYDTATGTFHATSGSNLNNGSLS